MDAETFADAIRSDDYRKALTALRDRLAEGVLEADDRRLIHLAPLSKQLMDVLDRLDKLPADEAQGDVLDDLVARRAARIAAAQAG